MRMRKLFFDCLQKLLNARDLAVEFPKHTGYRSDTAKLRGPRVAQGAQGLRELACLARLPSRPQHDATKGVP